MFAVEMSYQVAMVGLAGFVVCLLFTFRKVYPRSYQWPTKDQTSSKPLPSEKIAEDKSHLFLAQNITPLPEFNWQTTPPLKMRPFKPKYHLTMGLSNLPISSLLEFDSNYLTRLALRHQILTSHPSIAIQTSPSATPAINELYTWLVTTYLPTRFPTIFTLSPTTKTLLNSATSLSLPLIPPPNPFETLTLLGENLDEDFLFLLPDEDGGSYRLKAYVTCFPSGFNTKEKFGLTLREIHGPVPGYKEKLALSMDRFFERVEVGRLVGRSNWAITTNDQLFSPGGTHLYEGQNPNEEEVVDIKNTYLRSERQTLHRLPQTGALVFAFKTYLYPLQDIKDEGLGEILAEAIDGLKNGSVPEMHFYKRGVVWGEAVKGFLRG